MKRVLSLGLLVKTEPHQMSHAVLVHKEVSFRTPATNAGDVYLADSYASANDANMRYVIPAGSHEKINTTNLDKLWYFGTAGDFLYLLTEIEKE